MIKVILADDEQMALEGIELMTDWTALGYEVCGTCDNGEDALMAIQECRPDLVVTDIRMPGLDGLELIRKARESGSEAMFVILSGHDDFDYARTALRSGVRHYLLKPVMEEEWELTLKEVAAELQERERLRGQEDRAESRLLSLAIARMLRDESLDADSSASERMAQLDGTVTSWRYLHLEGLRDEDREDCRRFSQPGQAVYVERGPGQAGFVAEGEQTALPLAKRLYDELRGRGKPVLIAVGPRVASLRELAVSYSGAVEAAIPFFYQPDASGLVDSETAERPAFSYDIDSVRLVERIMAAAERLQDEETVALIGELFARFEEKRTAPGVVYMISAHVVLKSLEVLRELGVATENWRDCIGFLRTEPESLAALKQALQDFLRQDIDLIRRHKEADSRHPLQKVERYLQENFRMPVTIKEIGERFYIHPVYLGQAFLRKHGVSLLEYVHNLRIEEAKRRLAESEETIRVIAEEVGYQHYHHFLKEFEKRTALKPAVYRKHRRGEG